MILAVKIIAGVLIGIACKFIGDYIEKYLLDARGLEFKRGQHEDYLIIAAMAMFGGLIMWRIPLSARTVYVFLLLIVCEVIVLADLHHRVIPNDLLIAILVLKVVFGIPDLFGAPGFPTFHIVDSLVGMVVGFVVFMLPALMSKQVGAGDVKLAAVAGFALGLMGVLVAIVIMGWLVAVYAVLQREAPILVMIKTMIPMGPFLAIGIIVVMLLPMHVGSIPI